MRAGTQRTRVQAVRVYRRGSIVHPQRLTGRSCSGARLVPPAQTRRDTFRLKDVGAPPPSTPSRFTPYAVSRPPSRGSHLYLEPSVATAAVYTSLSHHCPAHGPTRASPHSFASGRRDSSPPLKLPTPCPSAPSEFAPTAVTLSSQRLRALVLFSQRQSCLAGVSSLAPRTIPVPCQIARASRPRLPRCAQTLVLLPQRPRRLYKSALDALRIRVPRPLASAHRRAREPLPRHTGSASCLEPRYIPASGGAPRTRTCLSVRPGCVRACLSRNAAHRIHLELYAHCAHPPAPTRKAKRRTRHKTHLTTSPPQNVPISAACSFSHRWTGRNVSEAAGTGTDGDGVRVRVEQEEEEEEEVGRGGEESVTCGERR
ncbi:hypothetical protein DFH06DRAFT_751401 [Mycena polygramma]|nr:hypothetical protein DFH06DRAFT_751401 [Mycena polygramma]